MNNTVYISSIALIAMLTASAQLSSQAQGPEKPERPSATWESSGADLRNTRNQLHEGVINSSNVQGLKVKWIFTTGGDVSATPTVSGDAVYAPDWAGNLFAIQKSTGKEIWHHQIAEYNGTTGAMTRVSPLVLKNQIVIGDNVINQNAPHGGASIIA